MAAAFTRGTTSTRAAHSPRRAPSVSRAAAAAASVRKITSMPHPAALFSASCQNIGKRSAAMPVTATMAIVGALDRPVGGCSPNQRR